MFPFDWLPGKVVSHVFLFDAPGKVAVRLHLHRPAPVIVIYYRIEIIWRYSAVGIHLCGKRPCQLPLTFVPVAITVIRAVPGAITGFGIVFGPAGRNLRHAPEVIVIVVIYRQDIRGIGKLFVYPVHLYCIPLVAAIGGIDAFDHFTGYADGILADARQYNPPESIGYGESPLFRILAVLLAVLRIDQAAGPVVNITYPVTAGYLPCGTAVAAVVFVEVGQLVEFRLCYAFVLYPWGKHEAFVAEVIINIVGIVGRCPVHLPRQDNLPQLVPELIGGIACFILYFRYIELSGGIVAVLAQGRALVRT
ncbi:MAG: hypothetical protein LBV71_03895 [Prevotella sp.]|nr:hypothetical protein [Prevotella sp.]